MPRHIIDHKEKGSSSVVAKYCGTGLTFLSMPYDVNNHARKASYDRKIAYDGHYLGNQMLFL